MYGLDPDLKDMSLGRGRQARRAYMSWFGIIPCEGEKDDCSCRRWYKGSDVALAVSALGWSIVACVLSKHAEVRYLTISDRHRCMPLSCAR